MTSTERAKHATITGLTDWIGLAGAPIFAVLAVLTTIPDGDAVGVLCGVAPASFLGGMNVMYALMAGLHIGPWIKLFASRP
jgi:hypothetical protein